MILDSESVAREEIAKIYIAAFNRVPDKDGLQNWVNQYLYNDMNYEDIASDFANQPEYKSKYPDTMTKSEYITAIYNNVFGRDPDEGGLQNWVNQILYPEISGIDEGSVMQMMLESATQNPENQDGIRLINQSKFAIEIINNNISTTEATTQLNNITSDVQSVTNILSSYNVTYVDSDNNSNSDLIYNKTWSIEDTSYFEIGDNLLFEVNYDSPNGMSYYMSNYTATGDNSYNLTGLDGDLMTISMNSLSVGEDMNIVSPSENINETAKITSTGEIELTNQQSVGNLFKTYYPDGTYDNITPSQWLTTDNYFIMDDITLKVYPNDNNIYKVVDDFVTQEVVGISTIKDDTLYLAYDINGAFELAAYDFDTQLGKFYYLGEVA